MDKITVKVPASTSNLGSGFDSIGVALKLYLTVTSVQADQMMFHWNDNSLVNLEDKDNLILKGIHDVYEHCHQNMPNLSVTVRTEIPLARGLGSSATAYIAGLITGNEWLNRPLSDDELFWLAVKQEGHPDNAGPTIFGGCVLSTIDWDEEKAIYQKLTFPDQWRWIAAIPAYKLSTAEARGILPETYHKKDVVYNLSRYGMLINAIIHEDRGKMKIGLQDQLHQPYRLHLIPGLKELLTKADEFNAIGMIISGAGPTVLSLTDKETEHTQLVSAMRELLSKDGNDISIVQLPVEQDGYVVKHS
ncbi:homoserine kinase [Bacillaceae bacterium W0354]